MLSIKACDASSHFHKSINGWQDMLLGIPDYLDELGPYEEGDKV